MPQLTSLVIKRALPLLCAASLAAALGCRPPPTEQSAAATHGPQETPTPMASETGPASSGSISPFRSAYEALAGAPPGADLGRVRGAAALAGLQNQIRAGDYALVGPLRERLDADDPAIRAAAVGLLGTLAAAARGPDADPAIQAYAESAAQAVEEALDDPQAEVRLEATRQLAALEDPARVPALLARLRDPDPLVRFQALSGLQRLEEAGGDPRIRDAARALLQDPDPQVRRLAGLLSGRN